MALPGGEENIPYRSPIAVEEDTNEVTRDEEEFSTLVSVRDQFAGAIEDLYKDFNAFDPRADLPDDEAVKLLREDIRAKKGAYAILEPLFSQLDTSVKDVENQRKGA